jgi:hypothetical protein
MGHPKRYPLFDCPISADYPLLAVTAAKAFAQRLRSRSHHALIGLISIIRSFSGDSAQYFKLVCLSIRGLIETAVASTKRFDEGDDVRKIRSHYRTVDFGLRSCRELGKIQDRIRRFAGSWKRRQTEYDGYYIADDSISMFRKTDNEHPSR